MGKLIHYLQGVLRLRITGPFPERLLNLCAQERLDFWAVTYVDSHVVCITICRSARKRVQELAEHSGCAVEQEESHGLPDFLLRFHKRYAFLIGLTLSLCAVGVLSRFVLQIEVTGNETVSTAVILNELQRLGVKPGVYGPGLDRPQIAQEALLALDQLSWMGINLSGTHLHVQVREKQPQPERIDEEEFYHIAAETDGIVVHVEPELGDAVVKAGDTVIKDQILISGTVTLEPPQYSDLPNRYYQKHARGRVWARTWRTLEAVIPVEATGKSYTQEEQNCWRLNFFGRQIEIFGKSSISWPFYDKITSVYQAQLPDGTTLPVWFSRETCRKYEPESISIDRDAAQVLLEQQLKGRLEQLIGETGQIRNESYTAKVTQGMLRVTLQAECYEEIGYEVPGTQLFSIPGENFSPL